MLASERTRTRNVQLAVAMAKDGRPGYVIAGEARVLPGQLSGYLSGRLTPPPAHAQRIATALGADVSAIFPEAVGE
jgi:hypothetical protein